MEPSEILNKIVDWATTYEIATAIYDDVKDNEIFQKINSKVDKLFLETTDTSKGIDLTELKEKADQLKLFYEERAITVRLIQNLKDSQKSSTSMNLVTPIMNRGPTSSTSINSNTNGNNYATNTTSVTTEQFTPYSGHATSKASGQVINTPKILTSLALASINQNESEVTTAQKQNSDYSRNLSISRSLYDTITMALYDAKVISEPKENLWKSMVNDEFYELLRKYCVNKDGAITANNENIVEKIVKVIKLFNVDMANIGGSISAIITQIYIILRENQFAVAGDLTDTMTPIVRKQLYKELLDGVTSHSNNSITSINAAAVKRVAEKFKINQDNVKLLRGEEQILSFLNAFKKALEDYNEKYNETKIVFERYPNLKRDREDQSNTTSKTKSNEQQAKQPRNSNKNDTNTSTFSECDGCGRKHAGNRDACKFSNHPDFNTIGKWSDSEIAKVTKEKLSYDTLCVTKKFNSASKKFDVFKDYKSNDGGPKRDSNKTLQHQKKSTNGKSTLLTMTNNRRHINIANGKFILSATDRLEVTVLKDTGAVCSGSFISGRVGAWLKARGAECKIIPKVVCSCFGDCRDLSTMYILELYFNDGVTNPKYTKVAVTLNFWVIDALPYDVVLGNDDIESSTFLTNLHLRTEVKQIGNKRLRNHNNDDEQKNISCSVCNMCGVSGSSGRNISSQITEISTQNVKRALSENKLEVNSNAGSVIGPSGGEPKPNIPNGTIKHISELLDFEKSAFGIPDKWDSLDELLSSEINDTGDVSENLMVVEEVDTFTDIFYIEGDEQLQKDIKSLLKEYKDIFRTNVSSKPAVVEPMEIKIDREKWNNMKGNNIGPRIQSQTKNDEIRRQIEKMKALGIIRESQANRYSQVVLAPKPNDKWRFCIDYQNLNSCCENEGWNIPNIGQMLQRLGGHRPKLLAVMDLTSGYHQTLLSLASIVLTAFITFMGVFEWTRVPMGLKGAPGYFQRVLATSVLAGLIYSICELYIDDIIVHAQNAEDYIKNLRVVFERLRKHNITLNPEKCKFGLKKVEYVGHTIDESGLSFSREKIEQVLAIPPPKYGKELKSFLGLASYFRDHIRNYADMSRPLQLMIANYEKKRKLEWTEQGTQAFKNIREAIQNCPKLFFIDDNSPVYLHTDASDYGIGGYVFQIVDGKEIPIAFMSKLLSIDELKWKVIEKECYAIVMALRKFEYLLRDRKFTLRTDHANLLYVNDPAASPKVQRWKLGFQEHDMLVEHIAGVKNIVADGFSRLLPISEEILCLLKEFTKIPDDKYRILNQVHNSQVGHHGVDRMMSKLTELKHEWPQMREHVKTFIAKCPCCQKMNNMKVAIHTHPYTLSSAKPMEILHMDTLAMGTEDDYGNSYLLVLIDSCSRWVELKPIKDLSAETAAKELVEHFSRWGQPAGIRSDNGTQFVNELHEEMYRLTGIEHIRTIPHSHEENGIVERVNREILRHVRSILFDRNIHNSWNMAIPIVQRILNST